MASSASHNKKYIGYLQCLKEFGLYVIDPDTELIVDRKRYQPVEFKNQLPTDVYSLKALTITVCNYIENSFPYNILFFQNLSNQLSLAMIPHFIIDETSLAVTALLMAANITTAPNDTLITLIVAFDEIILIEIFREPFGYKMIQQTSVLFKLNYEPMEILNKIIKRSKPKAIIVEPLFFSATMMDVLKNTFSESQQLIILRKNAQKDYLYKSVIEMANCLFDNNLNKFHIIPYTACAYFIANRKADNGLKHLVLSIDQYTKLPFTEAKVLSRNEEKFFIFANMVNNKPFMLQKSVSLNENCHKMKLEVKININQCIDFEMKPLIDDKIIRLPETLIRKTFKVPIIGFFDNSSVICLHTESEEYRFLEKWKGMFGSDLFLNCGCEKPYFCDKIEDNDLSMPSYIIYDLIKIMSMPPSDIKVNPDWGFKLTKTENNPILLEFNTFNKTKKCASPAFLMALILKEHLKVIKAEIGQYPKQLGFVLFDDFTKNAKKRIKKELKESCNLLKIDCFFT